MVKQDDEKAEKILQDFKQFSSFSIDANLGGFSSLFGQISNNCLQAFEFGPKNDGYGIPEDEFRNSIEEIYFQLENYLNGEWYILTSLFLIILFLIFMHIKLTYFSFYLAKGTISQNFYFWFTRSCCIFIVMRVKTLWYKSIYA